jgi:hypothetical protein
MIDKKMVMPKYYKNSENKVIHPSSKDILKQYIIYPGFGFYHSLPPKKYKAFKYDFELDKLIPTNMIDIRAIHN